MPVERIDQAVPGLVGNRLLLVAPARKRHDRGARGELPLEVVEKRALARPGAAVHAADDDRARSGLLERPRERREVRLAAHERQLRLPGFLVRAGRRRRRAGQRRAQRGGAGPPFGVAIEERQAQVAQVRGHAGSDGGRRGRRPAARRVDQLVERPARPAEGLLSGERFVEHHADRVPVAGRGQRQRRRLLRRHVVDRPGEVAVGRLVDAAQAPGASRRRSRGRVRRRAGVHVHLGHEAEVEQAHPPVGRHQHVLGLEVTVQHAGGVESRHAIDELRERRAQARLVGRRRTARERLGARLLRDGLGASRHRDGAALGHGGRLVRHAAARLVPDPAPEVDGSLEQLHGEAPGPAVLEELVERQQVRVRERGEGAELLLEEIERGRILPAHGLERHAVPALAVVDLVDRAHAAGAEQADDGEALGARERLIPRSGHDVAGMVHPRLQQEAT